MLEDNSLQYIEGYMCANLTLATMYSLSQEEITTKIREREHTVNTPLVYLKREKKIEQEPNENYLLLQIFVFKKKKKKKKKIIFCCVRIKSK